MKLDRILVATLMVVLSTCVARADKPRVAGKRVAKPEPVTVTPQPVLPAVPLTLEQQPATSPQVTFQNGRLTIVAPNSTLGDVLRAVHAQTGAAVEIPANATERVVGDLGPGPARDVLASLLNGSHFNYVLLGSASNPNALDRVILIPKTGAGEESSQVAQNDPGNVAGGEPQQAQLTPGTPLQPQADTDDTSSDDLADDTSDTDMQDNSQQTADEQQQSLPQPPNAPRTPEQLLQELQRQQQLQQQQGFQPGMPGMPPINPGMAPINPGMPPGEGATPPQNRE